ncbi:hypothetical protein Lfee_1263 [Legionella feeleii]|uniref:Uncharacterized protein n=1 Tax=Legionella feeleii TaxID=453 RepID=A0A0W0TXX0_9GAMM|nr:hypothetical protein Lfee_1263 [Legionella feeleii]SPX60148.1 Uncharacterised protein [Legionella feeleii]
MPHSFQITRQCSTCSGTHGENQKSLRYSRWALQELSIKATNPVSERQTNLAIRCNRAPLRLKFELPSFLRQQKLS